MAELYHALLESWLTKLAASRTTKPSPAPLEMADGSAAAPRWFDSSDIGYCSQAPERKPQSCQSALAVLARAAPQHYLEIGVCVLGLLSDLEGSLERASERTGGPPGGRMGAWLRATDTWTVRPHGGVGPGAV